MSKYVLSPDGGGIFSVTTYQVLAYIEQRL